jgi:hypothetical protein
VIFIATGVNAWDVVSIRKRQSPQNNSVWLSARWELYLGVAHSAPCDMPAQRVSRREGMLGEQENPTKALAGRGGAGGDR